MKSSETIEAQTIMLYIYTNILQLHGKGTFIHKSSVQIMVLIIFYRAVSKPIESMNKLMKKDKRVGSADNLGTNASPGMSFFQCLLILLVVVSSFFHQLKLSPTVLLMSIKKLLQRSLFWSCYSEQQRNAIN